MSQYDSGNHSKGKGRGSLYPDAEDRYSAEDQARGSTSQPRTIRVENRSPSQSVSTSHPNNYELSTSHPRSTRPPLDPRRGSSNEVSRTQDTSADERARRLAMQFLEIDLDEFKECAAFVDQRPDVLEGGTDFFQQVASQAYKQDKVYLAERCLERIIIIRGCAGLDVEDSCRYIRSLGKAGSAQKQFKTTFSTLKTAFKSQAGAATVNSAAERLEVVGINDQAAASSTRRTSSSEHVPGRHSSSNIRTRRDSTAQNYGYGSTPAAILEERQSGQLTHAQQRPSARASRPHQSGYGGSIMLDPAYQVQTNVRDFFVVGRVLKILWHQPAGADLTGNVQSTKTTTTGKFNEPIHSSLRWMLVVGRRSGHCICCPISTYGQQGLRQNIRSSDIDAHAVVFEYGKKPYTFPEEHEMKKKPIAIVLDDDNSLDPRSRVHFGKFHCVEYNVKVMGIGRVHPQYINFVTGYSQDEFSGSSKT